jgi:hypothetical protein
MQIDLEASRFRLEKGTGDDFITQPRSQCELTKKLAAEGITQVITQPPQIVQQDILELFVPTVW